MHISVLTHRSVCFYSTDSESLEIQSHNNGSNMRYLYGLVMFEWWLKSAQDAFLHPSASVESVEDSGRAGIHQYDK